MNKLKSFEFYHSLKPFNDFSRLIYDSYYSPLPDDWTIVVTDIRGSTKAVKEGRSKEVNLIGAASITVYINLMATIDLPFIFGGDGATILVPNIHLENLITELEKLQFVALNNFQLDLRIGAVAMSELKILGCELKVAKYELSPGQYFAQIKGGAVSVAENLIKSQDSRARLFRFKDDINTASLNLYGLSCRLSPLKSVKGKIITLLCKPKNELNSSQIITDLLSALTSILNNDLKSATPVRNENIKWAIPAKHYLNEVKLDPRKGSNSIKILFSFLFSTLFNFSLQWGIKLGNFLPNKYKEELKLNSDFKKYDDTLRMVLDCSDLQIEKILALLNDYYKQNLISFGTHISSEALMTCVVFSPTNNQHIHFIDGANGGYTLAAVNLKKQMV